MATTVDPLGSLGLALQQPQAKKAQLGQDEFLKLMVTQLQNQDPFKPMESGAFLTQIAQFSTVTGIQSMQNSLSTLAGALSSSQALQGAQLVGRGVLVPSDTGFMLADGSLDGAVNLPSAGQLIVDITDASGQAVGHYDLGTQAAGLVPFSWDGKDIDGVHLPAGNYNIKARLIQGSSESSVPTLAVGLVQSVSLDGNGLTLNLLGLDSVSLGQVYQIM